MKKNEVFSLKEKRFMPVGKILKIMKVLTFVMLVFVIHVSARSYSQNTKLSMNLQNVSIKQVLTRIEDQSEYRFLYSDSKIDVEKIVDVDFNNKPVEDILRNMFEGSNIQFKIAGRQILLSNSNESLGNGQQQKSVSGKVTDSSGALLPGVSVVVKETTTGSITDGNGNYSLTNIPANATLLFSFVGMKTQEIAVGNKAVINVILKDETIGIEEVVAVGYGTQKKSNLTGSVSSVKGDELITRPVANSAALLQGKMAGVQVIQTTGEPGNEGVNIRIRGTGTFSDAGSDPLVLIDGVQGDLSTLDPSVIENVSVLKDAASASIYGSRAANGVILVTTKSGSKGKLQIEYNGSYAVKTPTKLFDLITNSADYMTLWNEGRVNSGFGNIASGLYTQAQIDAYKNATDRNQYPNFDWVRAGINSAPTQTHNLSINGTTGNTKYNVALGYIDEQGTMIGYSNKRYSGRINITSQLNKSIKFGTNLSLRNDDRLSYRVSSNEQFASLMAQAPTYSPQLPDGSGRYTYKAYAFESNNKNTFAISDPNNNCLRNTVDYAFTSQLWTEVNIFKGLTWYTKAALNGKFTRWNDFGPKVQLYNFHTGEPMATLDVGTKGRTEEYNHNVYSNVFSYLNYERAFNDHSVKIQVGYSQESNKYNFAQAARTNYVSDALKELNAGSNAVMSNSGTMYEWALQSYFGRLNYDYKGRYLLEANMRYDGSSRISPDSRWGIFPSFSAGWRVTEEQLVKNMNLTWLNNFKIRGSWGQLGNQNVNSSSNNNAPYPYQALLSLTSNYAFNNSVLSSGVAQTALNNTNIKWESTTITDFGFDLTVLNGLSATFDWYDKTTSDILRASQVNYLVGLDAPIVNNGKLQNRGIELGLNYNRTIMSGALQGLNYYVGANFEHYKNKLVSFGSREINGYRLREEGREWDTYYMIKQIGIFQTAAEVASSPKQYADNTQPGDLKFVDLSGPDGKPDGVVNDYDRVPIEGNFPKLNYSFNLGGSWKGLDLSATFQGVYGVKTFVNEWGTIPFIQGAPPTTDWYNRWTPTNPSTTMPRIYWGQTAPDAIMRNSTYFLQDASYFRLKNLTVGYTLPARLTDKVGIDKLRIYISGDNLFTATKYPGLDPERPADNSFVQYPQNKVYSFGVNLNF